MTFISTGTSTGTSAHEILAPDLGLLLATEMQTWPPELTRHDRVRWVRDYRERLTDLPQRSGDESLDALAHRALCAALLWRVDLCVKLLIHIGWQWTTATQLLDEIDEATTPARLATARHLAREQFENLENQRRADQLASSPDASEQLPSPVLQATDTQLDAALLSIYAKSRAYHTQRLTQAKAWWPAWVNEACLLQWQADLCDRLDDRFRYRMLANDAEAYETLQALESLCQTPPLFSAMVRAMEQDGADPQELVAPDHALWPPAYAQPIGQYFDLLLTDSESQQQRDVITYWLAHARLPDEIKPLAAPDMESLIEEEQSPISGPIDVETTTSLPEGADLWIGSALMQEALGQIEQALASYARALELREDPSIWRASAKLLAQLHRYEEALVFYDRSLELYPDDYLLWHSKGEALHALGRSDEARAAFDKEAALRRQRNEEALARYDHDLELHPDDPFLWHGRGESLRELGRGDEARAAFDKEAALRQSSYLGQFRRIEVAEWRARGLAEIDAGAYAAALDIFERALALDPRDGYTSRLKAVTLARLGRYAEALQICDGLLEQDPNNPASWNTRAYVFLYGSRYDDALASIDNALAIQPEEPNWWDSRGEILLAAGRYGEAVAAYDNALAIDPNFAPSLRGRALTLQALHTHEGASFFAVHEGATSADMFDVAGEALEYNEPGAAAQASEAAHDAVDSEQTPDQPPAPARPDVEA